MKFSGYLYAFLSIGILFPDKVNAQFETANWILSGDFSINFVDENPTTSNRKYSNSISPHASYSNEFGDLLMYTDGSTIWNSKSEVMKNGEGLKIIPYSLMMIIPKPGADSVFYLFGFTNTAVNNSDYILGISYSIVDLKANEKKGEVIEKNKLLYSGMHGSYTISGSCDRSVFWLVGDVDINLIEGTDKIYIYQIDKNGIAGPFTSYPLRFGNSGNFKLSPDAKKILFSVDGNGASGTLIADFEFKNLPKEPIVNYKPMIGNGPGEFSSNGKFVYVASGKKIFQYDVQTGKSFELFSGDNYIRAPQMAPNGLIYFPVDNEKKLLVVNKPNLAGSLCEFDETGFAVDVTTPYLPQFPSSFFYEGANPANAGLDKYVCPNEGVAIGSQVNYNTDFKWEPETYLDDPTQQQPVFRYQGTDSLVQSFKYKFSVNDNGCLSSDIMVVKLIAKPSRPQIFGSKSVCPGVEGVEYWTNKKENGSYFWSIDGGVIANSVNSDTLLVNWGSSNPLAQVGLQVTDDQQCTSDITKLNVLINVELQTEMPRGLDSVCVNLKNHNQYQITKTTGSVYTWEVFNGEIIGELIKNKVVVNWFDTVPGKLWVKEKSVTNEAVCFGTSDTLNVTVFKDPAVASIDYVTIDEVDETRINLSATIFYSNRVKELNVLSRREGLGVWENIGSAIIAPHAIFSAKNFQTDDYTYQFQLEMVNKCEERWLSHVHHSIRLAAEGDEQGNVIDLNWRSYNFWNLKDVSYDILKSIKEPQEYQKAFTVLNDTASSIGADQSFLYLLRVKAIRSDGIFTSLSNEVKLEFNHELFIPNVITPNNDGFNDTFEITNIKFYPLNRLVILNQYGQILFDQSGYQGGWGRDNSYQGVFYYKLLVPEKHKEYKGWLHVIR